METKHLIPILCILLFLMSTCKKTEKLEYAQPLVYTHQTLELTNTKALLRGKFSKGSDNITAFGFEWKKATDSDYKKVSAQVKIDNFSATITDLEEDTKYYVIAFLIDASNKSYYAKLDSFITKGTVKDIDGNVYLTYRYGNKVWMTENLRVTRFADGTPIEARSSGKNPPSDGPVYYHDLWHTANYAPGKPNFGLLYNWAAAAKADSCNYRLITNPLDPKTSQGICPDGWHLPSGFEWDNLINMYGGRENAASSMKTSNWADSHYPTANSSHFSTEPAGFYHWNIYNNIVNEFNGLNESAYLWTSAQHSDKNDHTMAGAYMIVNGFPKIEYSVRPKSSGNSVRCVKN